MSAKWRALQHRHRYTYSSVVFPASFLQSIHVLEAETAAATAKAAPFSSTFVAKFLANLKNIASLDTMYAQVAAAKDLSSSFSELLANAEDGLPAELVCVAAKLYLEIMFLDNSLPLHRMLLSALAKSRKSLPAVEIGLLSLCREYGRLGKEGRIRFRVSRAVLSLMGYPKLGFLNGTIEKCARLVAMDVATGLTRVIEDIDLGSRPSPAAMEQCQDAMSCLYYLLQKFPSEFANSEKEEEECSDIFRMVLRVILSMLESYAFSRDCLVAAGVSFCAGLQAQLSPPELAKFIVQGFFGIDRNKVANFDAKVLLIKGSLFAEISKFPVLSRICLFRGMLTAVPRSVLNTRFIRADGLSLWTILYNGILPELCDYCENPVDSHFNFHVLTVMQICLQQIKTSLLSDLTDFSGDYDPLPGGITARLLRIMWNNLEDPLNQTVKQVHIIFDLFLDIKSSVPSGEGREGNKSFLCQIASDLLQLGSRCKGRYVPLASLTRRLSAKVLLEMKPKLVFETVAAYIDDDVCSAVTSFLKCFLECLRDECWSSCGVEQGYYMFRGLCLPPIMDGLVSGVSKLRSNLNTYAAPVVLNTDVDSIFSMLASISVVPIGEESEMQHMDLVNGQLIGEVREIQRMDLSSEQCVAALVSLLKVSRQLALVEGDIDWDHSSPMHDDGSGCFAVLCVKGTSVKVPVVWFVQALTHVDESLRIDAAESLFLNPKIASLPSALEVKLMKEVIPLNMRCCSTAFQMKWTSLFRKFFCRVRTALERQVKQGWQPNDCLCSTENGYADDSKYENIRRARELFSFMRWLSNFLFFSCYPSAPYERKTMAMGLLLLILDVWPTVPPSQGDAYLYPYGKEFTSPGSTLSLVGSIIDSWDRLRESSFRILLYFPNPLPGVSSCESVTKVIKWAKKLVCSPRVRESDAGAFTLRLVFKKYVLELAWIVGVSADVICFRSQSEMVNGVSQTKILKERTPVVHYISSLIDWLRIVVEEGEKDLSEACRNCFVHGVLLTLRYTFEELDWNLIVDSSSIFKMKSALEELLGLIMRITSLALWVVSADAWYLPDESDDMVSDEAFLSGISVEVDPDSSLEVVEGSLKLADIVQTPDQVVMVGCWLAMKEVSLLLGTVIRKIPLPSCRFSDSQKPGTYGDLQMMAASDIILDLKQLETIGNHFMQVLLKMKHNGAIDKTRAGFTALCNRLLCSNDARLCKMTESWMEQLMERTVAKGQTVDDLLRRSAGIPAAFMALFLSEPEGAPKKLLPNALGWLIDVAKKSLCSSSEACNHSSIMMQSGFSENLNQVSLLSFPMESDLRMNVSKIRDEGVIPTVHALNVLRAAFNDTNLAADASGFCVEALIVSIRAFSSPYWEVRNSACLAYTALVRRMIGFLNVQKRESARRALTGLEFFHRYPALHPFLFGELKIATELFGDGLSGPSRSNVIKAIHPSLCPILILLSRLKPSFVGSDASDTLDPVYFMPFIMRCATQSNLRVRVLASRALTGLVSNEKLPAVIMGIAEGLSCRSSQVATAESGFYISTSQTESNDDETTTLRCISFNAIHGILAQLNSLLDINCRNLNDTSKKDLILGNLIQVLRKCSWVGSFKLCLCPTLISSFLQVLTCMLDIARMYKSGHIVSIQALLLKLSSECLDRGKTGGYTFYDPTVLEVHKQAAISFFSCFSEAGQEVSEENLLLQKPDPTNSCKMHESDGAVGLWEKIEGNNLPALQQKILSCVFDSSYEVRLVMLKLLLQFIKTTNPNDGSISLHLWAMTNLQPLLIKQLDIEDNPKCICYILRNIFSWNLIHFVNPKHLHKKDTTHIGTMNCDFVLAFWDRLVSLTNIVRHNKTREALLCCMGLCIRKFRLFGSPTCVNQSQYQVEGKADISAMRVDQLERWDLVYKCINKFIISLKLLSSSSEPVNMRKAAAESLIASGLLEEAPLIGSHVSNERIPSDELPICTTQDEGGSIVELHKTVNLYGCRVLDVWFTCIQLLEDEDVGLRQKLAKDVQSCINTYMYRQNVTVDTVPLQVERVLKSSFDFLSSVFGHWIEYIGYLLKWVLHSGDYEMACGNLVRQVFDKEIDNHHEEKLLICQICCSHLEGLLHSPYWLDAFGSQYKPVGNIVAFLGEWRSRFLHKLVSFADDNLKDLNRTDWVGGIGNHKDAFMPVYANLLGLYTLLQCQQEGFCLPVELAEEHKLLSSDFVRLSGTISPFLANPLISNLYSLVLLSKERLFGVSATDMEQKHTEISVWEDFDPYFLLK